MCTKPRVSHSHASWSRLRCTASLTVSNPKVFFAYVRRNRQLSRQILSLKRDLDAIVKEPEAQAELLNEFYVSVFRTDNEHPITALPIPMVMMGIPVFTPWLVHKELSTLDNTKSPGPDQQHPKLFKLLPPFSRSPWQTYLTTSLRQPACRMAGRRQWFVQNSRRGTQKTFPTTVQWGWLQWCVWSSNES